MAQMWHDPQTPCRANKKPPPMRRRVGHCFRWAAPKTTPPPLLAAVLTERSGLRENDHRVEEIFVLGRPGSDLLFQVLRLSTIGAGEFYGRVRDGIGYRPPAKTTRPAKDE